MDIRPRSRPKAAEPEPEPVPEAVAVAEPPSDDGGVLPVADLFGDVSPPPEPVATDMRQDVQAAVREAVAGMTAPTMVIDRPLRSGQRVYARGGDLVILGVVSHGAEVIADGNIHIYGPLRGRAIAGASGDTEARIFAGAMEPELISIAGTYRTTDKPLAADVHGKAALARLDGEKMLFEPLKN
jgi:septum site-determining protein MinC